MTPSFILPPYTQKKFLEIFRKMLYVCNMEILENISIALVMGVISYYIWSRKDDDKGNIKRGDEWD
jgi:hypothetical protein